MSSLWRASCVPERWHGCPGRGHEGWQAHVRIARIGGRVLCASTLFNTWRFLAIYAAPRGAVRGVRCQFGDLESLPRLSITLPMEHWSVKPPAPLLAHPPLSVSGRPSRATMLALTPERPETSPNSRPRLRACLSTAVRRRDSARILPRNNAVPRRIESGHVHHLGALDSTRRPSMVP